jgi:hypothetical protein
VIGRECEEDFADRSRMRIEILQRVELERDPVVARPRIVL